MQAYIDTESDYFELGLYEETCFCDCGSIPDIADCFRLCHKNDVLINCERFRRRFYSFSSLLLVTTQSVIGLCAYKFKVVKKILP